VRLPKRVAANPPGTTFCLQGGVHRLTRAIVPKAGSAFIGQRGAVVSGARDITTAFVPAGSHWVASGMKMEGTYDPGYGDDPCGPPWGPAGSTLCLRTNDVYYDNRLLTRVGSLSELSRGEFFFDYGADKIYIANHPRGHTVEVGVAPQALRSAGTDAVNVTVSGLVIEKFATPAASYAMEGKTGWVLDHLEVRLNHACGATAPLVRSSVFHDNGQCGFAGGDGPVVVEHNEFYKNHRIPIACWDSASVKIMRSHDAVIRDNYAHDEDCVGLWTDWDNIRTLYEGNRVERVGGPGIFHEASFDAVIRSNVVRDSGFDSQFDGWIDGSGILVNSSRNVEVYGNTVVGNRHGIGATNTERGSSPRYGVREVVNLRVYDNVVKVTSRPRREQVAAGVAGIISQPFVRQAFFDRNQYAICGAAGFAGPLSPGSTMYGVTTWQEWRAEGEDPSSTISFGC
jgi:hypothetical protein